MMPVCPCCCPRVQTTCCERTISSCLVGTIESLTECWQGYKFVIEYTPAETGPSFWVSPNLFTEQGDSTIRVQFYLTCTEDGFQLSNSRNTEIAYPDEINCGPPLSMRFTFTEDMMSLYCPGGLTVIIEEAPVECDCCCCTPSCVGEGGGVGFPLFELTPFVIGDGTCAVGSWVNNEFPPYGLGNRFLSDSAEAQTSFDDCITYYTSQSGRIVVLFDEFGNAITPDPNCLKDETCVQNELYAYGYGSYYSMRVSPSEIVGKCKMIIRLLVVRVCRDDILTPVHEDFEVAGEWTYDMDSSYCHNHALPSPQSIILELNEEQDPGYFDLPETIELTITCDEGPGGGGDEDPPGDGDGIG
jgi:hypothetical protein